MQENRIGVSPNRRGIALLMFIIILFIAIPFVALMFDATLLYIIRARLQGAVDGGVLAGARSLSQGVDEASEAASAIASAKFYVALNYPSTYFFSQAPIVDSVVIDASVLYQRTITAKIHSIEPTLFMSFLGFKSSSVSATASTVRKDINLVLVLDRSGSLSDTGSCAPMKAAAINFAGNFAPGRDHVGLVSFATSVDVQLTLVWTLNQSTVATAINSIQCSGITNTGSALAEAGLLYNSAPSGPLKIVVLFTDGFPNAASMAMPLSPGSTFYYGTPMPTHGETWTTTLMPGYWGRFLTGAIQMDPTTGTKGLYIPRYASSLTGMGWSPLTSGGYMYYTSGPTPQGQIDPTILRTGDYDQTDYIQFAGCKFMTDPNSNFDYYGASSLKDLYGASMNGYMGAAVPNLPFSLLDMSGNTQRYSALMYNLADNWANWLRSSQGATIMTIGLGNSGVPPNNQFLDRIANTPASTGYNFSQPTGVYYYAAGVTDLTPAYQLIATQMWRLAK